MSKKTKAEKYIVPTPRKKVKWSESRQKKYEDKRINVLSPIRLTEPRASEVLKDIKVLLKDYDNIREGVLTAIKKEADRIRNKRKRK